MGGMLTCPNQNTLGVETFTSKAMSKPPMWFSFPSRYEDAYKLELDHFINVVQGMNNKYVYLNCMYLVCIVPLQRRKR